MRLLSVFLPPFLAVLACLAAASCDQRPIDVVPETNSGYWRTLHTLEAESYLDLDGISPTEVYGVGHQSGLFRFDGTGWSELGSPNDSGLKALSVVSPTEIYAVAYNEAYRFDGSGWSKFYEGNANDTFVDIWTLDGSSVFVASLRSGVLRFDASLALVDSVVAGYWMAALWGSSQNDVFAAGFHDSILHFDGAHWTPLAAGIDEQSVFLDIHGVGPSEVYATGWRNLFRRYDGDKWSPVDLPDGISTIEAVWVAASEDVFLFYDGGGVVHYDGFEFEFMNSTTNNRLLAAWGASPDDIIAVGVNEKTLRYDGSGWTSLYGGLPINPNFLWGLDTRNLYIVDGYTVFRYDGAAVEELPRPDDAAPLSALWGSSPDDLVAVGEGGAIFNYDGAVWTRELSGTAVDLRSVTGLGRSVRYAVGVDRTVVRDDGSGWVVIREDPGSGIGYNDVWYGDGMAFVVGDSGSACRIHGVAWEPLNVGIRGDLLSVLGTSANNVFVAAEGGLFRYDGRRWNREVTHLTEHGDFRYHHLAGRGPENVFVAAGGMFLCHFNGQLWSPVKRGHVAGLWVGEDDRLYAVTPGLSGGLFVLER